MQKPNFKIDEIALVLIVAVMAVIVSVYDRVNQLPITEVEKLTETILDNYVTSFATNGVIDGDKLDKVQNMDYNDLKNALKIKNDFCVYIEDGNGEIVLAKGSSKLSRDGITCVK